VDKISDKEYSEYMLANFSLGYIDTSIFIGANLFEKYFEKNVSEKEAIRELQGNQKHPVLFHYIEAYVKYKSNEDVLSPNENNLKKVLHSFRDLRNDFIHDMNENKIMGQEKEIEKFILYIYFSFNKDKEYDCSIINKSINNTLLQDYKIKEITERMIARMEKQKIPYNAGVVQSFKSIDENDFYNLFELRKKLRYIQRHLENEMWNIGLVPTILSPVDSTSAYVWMPFVDEQFTDTINKFETKRNNLILGSTSILATPMDLRIYIDFGGGDYEYRLAFQDFIETKEFIHCIQKLNTQIHQIKIFDTKWYSFLTSEHNIANIISNNELSKITDRARKIIKKEEQEKNILTCGYNNVGYILPSNNISKKDIFLLFKNISYLYYSFLIYKFNDDKDVNILKDAKEKIFN